ncbi:hypothetical protein [Spirosoma lituiforme]
MERKDFIKNGVVALGSIALAPLLNSCKKDTDSPSASASVSALTCSSATASGAATINTAYSGSVTVPYTGGNGVAYTAGTAISSTGVTGLTATLQAGTLASGAGNLTYAISGTPTSSGTASFAITFGGQSCSFTVTVNAAVATTASVSALTCGSAVFSATSTINTAYSGTATVPYTGGNGVAYNAGTAISSTGVTGLTATLQAGTLASGAGNLTYAISGTPTSSGTASFAITFGGQTCSLALTVASATTSSCSQYPTVTEGPYPTKNPGSYVMSNITSDRTGTTLITTITIKNYASSCAAVGAGTIVDIWYCDAAGNYSQYGGTGSTQSTNYQSVNFLRGRQTTDANGTVTFTGIYPGWYEGRTTHIHLHVYSASGTSLVVAQIAFPETITSTVYAQGAYASHGQKSIANSSDNIFSATYGSGKLLDISLATVTGSVSAGYTLTHTIAY